MDSVSPARLMLLGGPPAPVHSRDQLIHEVVESWPNAMQLLDAAGRILLINQRAVHDLGIADAASRIGADWLQQFPQECTWGAKKVIEEALASGRASGVIQASVGGVLRWWELDATLVDGTGLSEPRILLQIKDTTKRKEVEARILWAARHDTVTGLSNRAAFQQALKERIYEAKQTGTRVAMLLLDVDNFKQTNDTLGHDAGDALLREFARRLLGAVYPTDLVARLGGDEFAILRSGDVDEKEMNDFGRSVFASLSAPFSYAERLIDCQASVGVAAYPQHGQDGSELFKAADLALYSAKRAGRGSLRIFQNQFRRELQQHTRMISRARQALDADRILPYYQPKICLRTGEIVGFEALLRWRHRTRGIRHPGQINAAFHDHRLASEISDRIIDKVLADVVVWRDRGLPFRHVAVNAAAAEFRSGRFAERLLERLCQAGLPTSTLQLEVTETVFLGRGAEYVERALKLLSREGIMIALDDFGTGFASLAHLKQFPVDVMKIDRSFVRNLHSDPDDAAIVAAVINLGRNLGIQVVAEGVEDQAQHTTLLDLGCEFAQGFLYQKAQRASRVPGLLGATRVSSACPMLFSEGAKR